MYDQQIFSGGVVARTVRHCIVQQPVVVRLDGIETELSLADAKQLLSGLESAVAAVEAAEQPILAGESGHIMVMGSTMYAMSPPPSKLPK